MPFRISGKNIDIGEALRQRVNARLVEALEKYFDRGYSGHVTVEKDGFGFRTECAIHLDSGVPPAPLASGASPGVCHWQAGVILPAFESPTRRVRSRAPIDGRTAGPYGPPPLPNRGDPAKRAWGSRLREALARRVVWLGASAGEGRSAKIMLRE